MFLCIWYIIFVILLYILYVYILLYYIYIYIYIYISISNLKAFLYVLNVYFICTVLVHDDFEKKNLGKKWSVKYRK